MALPATHVRKSVELTTRDNLTDVSWNDSRDTVAPVNRVFSKFLAHATQTVAVGSFITLCPFSPKFGIISGTLITAGQGTATGCTLKPVFVDANGTELGDVTSAIDVAAAGTDTFTCQTAALPYLAAPAGTAYIALKAAGAELPAATYGMLDLQVVRH